jgi:ribosomal protein S18 acetylase RimI-like enzyme
MPLPILTSHAQPSPSDLLRFSNRCELQWCRQIAEDEAALDVGTALVNARFSRVHDANQMMDASLPDGMTPADAVAQVHAYFEEQKSRCWKWTMNPSLPVERTQPLADYLLDQGYQRGAYDILYLRGRPAAIDEVAGLTIIPSRASFKHARVLEEESAAAWNEPQLVETAMLHLEDPHSDSAMALKDGVPAGVVTVLSVGEIGQIASLFVAERFRRQGIGRTLMSRALEICARSLFKHVLLSCEPANSPAQALYHRVGFQRIGETFAYRAPQTSP